MPLRKLLRLLSIALIVCLPMLSAFAVPAAAQTTPQTNAFNAHQEQLRKQSHGTFKLRAQSFFGLIVFVGITWVWGQARRHRLPANWHTVIWGLVLMFLFALFVLDTKLGAEFFSLMNRAVEKLLDYAKQGATFVFGNLVDNNVPVGQPVGDPTSGGPIVAPIAYAHTGALFAFFVLPTIIFFSSLCAVLYHIGIMQYLVQGLAWIMQKCMRTSGAETMSAAANIFLGQTEAPLLVKPFIAGATNSELMAVMVGGFANIASGVLGAYVGMLENLVPDAAGHLIAANVISAPASLLVAKLLLPEGGKPETAAGVKFQIDRIDANTIDAASRGAIEGLTLSLNVAAMLICFIALVAMANSLLGVAGGWFGYPHLTLELIFGYVMSPVAWLLGLPWSDCLQVGSLLGVKTVINEFVAYLNMSSALNANPNYITTRSAVITTYALCGFANFSSVAIQIGGISGMAPTRRGDLSRLGITAMFGGALASFMTACVVGVLL
jgi:CNT family concentrative nucleoside transporter